MAIATPEVSEQRLQKIAPRLSTTEDLAYLRQATRLSSGSVLTRFVMGLIGYPKILRIIPGLRAFAGGGTPEMVGKLAAIRFEASW